MWIARQALLSTGVVASYLVATRILASTTTGALPLTLGILLLALACAALAWHIHGVATGRGWRHSIEGESRCLRLAAIEALRKLDRTAWTEERNRALR